MALVKTSKYIRVVGYLGKIDDMNIGKKSEYNERRYMLK